MKAVAASLFRHTVPGGSRDTAILVIKMIPYVAT